MLRLHLVRHGHTIWNDTGGVAGRTDIDLSESGRQAVSKLAQTWLTGSELSCWYSSPLLRTRQTTELLRDGMPVSMSLPELKIDERLVELDFGDWEGMTWQAVHEHYKQEMDLWGQDWINRAPPNGETFAAQAARCGEFLRELSLSANGAYNVMVVLHGGSIRALVCLCLGWPLSRAMDFRVDPSTVTTLEQEDASAPWILRMLNSASFQTTLQSTKKPG